MVYDGAKTRHEQEEWVGCRRYCFWNIGKNSIQICLMTILLTNLKVGSFWTHILERKKTVLSDFDLWARKAHVAKEEMITAMSNGWTNTIMITIDGSIFFTEEISMIKVALLWYDCSNVCYISQQQYQNDMFFISENDKLAHYFLSKFLKLHGVCTDSSPVNYITNTLTKLSHSVH